MQEASVTCISVDFMRASPGIIRSLIANGEQEFPRIHMQGLPHRPLTQLIQFKTPASYVNHDINVTQPTREKPNKHA